MISFIAEKKPLIEESLSRLVAMMPYNDDILRAVEYTLFAGGKRVRPILGVLVLEMFDDDCESHIDILSIIEIIHTYSLIHDDLPCMDNDSMRRGRPTLHIKHSAGFAAYIGSFMLESSLYILQELMHYSALSLERSNQIMETIDEHIGFNGMVGGQVLDMHLNSADNEIKIEQRYINMIELKTARLIELSIKTACILSGADELSCRALSVYASNIGLLFQIIDDYLEVIGDEKIIGKSTDSDFKNKKITAVGLMGINETEKLADRLYANAVNSIAGFEERGRHLIAFAEYLRYRKN